MTFGVVSVRELFKAMRDVRAATGRLKPLVVDGVLADELARVLTQGGSRSFVRVGADATEACAYVLVVAGLPDETGVRRMQHATRAAVPLVVVQIDPRARERLPYVRAVDVITVPAGHGFPVDAIAGKLARLLAHDAVGLAARLPPLRGAVAQELIRAASLRAAVIGAAPWIRGAHLPLMALVQERLVLDLAAAHGRELEPRALGPELAAAAAAGVALRAVARRLPLLAAPRGAATGWAGTRAIGVAAHARFQTS